MYLYASNNTNNSSLLTSYSSVKQACGRVLGVHNGMVLEYDPSTLAPLGLVVAKDELNGRQVSVSVSVSVSRSALLYFYEIYCALCCTVLYSTVLYCNQRK